MLMRLFYATLLTLVLLGCNRKHYVNQGIIEYAVSYPELDSNNVLLKFMPQRMVMVFNQNLYKHDMRAGMGLFRTGFIHDSNTDKTTYFLKLANVKYKSIFTKDALKTFNQQIPKFNIIETEESGQKLGLPTRKVLIDYEDENEKDYALFYTEAINTTHPNSGFPFEPIEGVMLNFEIERYDLKMAFEAIDFIKAEITADEFELGDDFEEISNKEMERKIKETFVTLQM